jgi:hypothetical protein
MNKPKRACIFVEVEYWDCGHKEHKHKTEVVAAKCIEERKHIKPPAPKEVNYKKAVIASRIVINGGTYVDAGKAINLSGARAAQLTKALFRRCIHPSRNPGEIPCYREISEMRKHKKYWLSRIDYMEKYYGVTDEN